MSGEIKGMNVVSLTEYKAGKMQEKGVLKSYETVELLAEKFKKLDADKMIEDLPDFWLNGTFRVLFLTEFD